MRVQLAEDEPHIVEALTFVLERAGFEVAAHSDGAAALAAALAEPPDLMTYQDANNLVQAHKAEHEAAFFPNVLPLEPEKREIKPYMVEALFTTAGFFPIFEPPFRYGTGWTPAEDRNAARVAVIDSETNDKLFGGENSVGRKLRLGGEDFTVVGVLDRWNPQPKFYEPSSGGFAGAEEIYLPFGNGISALPQHGHGRP